MNKVVLKIKQIDKNISNSSLQQKLLKIQEIKDVKINNSKIKISYKNITIDDIELLLEKYGYKSLGIDNNKNIFLNNIILLIIQGLIITITLYITLANTYNLPVINIFNKKIRLILLLITSTTFIIISKNIIKDGIKRIIKGKYNLNSLITTVSLIIYIYVLITSFYYLNGNKSFYTYKYLEIMLIILSIKLYKTNIENYKLQKIEKEIKQISNTKSNRISKSENDTRKEITIDEISMNDTIICEANDRILMDGKVIRGTSHVDESLILGTSTPTLKKVNDYVIAGSENGENKIEYKVVHEMKDSYTAKIKKLICNLENKRNKKDNYLDNFTNNYLLILVLICLIVLVISYKYTNNFYKSITTYIDILIIFTPIGLIVSGYYPFKRVRQKLLRKGIIVKNISDIENINKVDSIFFDKTGTLTYGYMNITSIINHSNMTNLELLYLLSSIEKNSSHILGRGIMKYMRRERIKSNYYFQTEDLDDNCVKAKDEESTYYVGKNTILNKLRIDNNYLSEEKVLNGLGNEVIYLIKNNKVIALFGLKDVLKKESKRLINNLKKENIDVYLVSGDNEKITNVIGNELEIDNVYSNIMPDEKLKLIRKVKRKNKYTIMIGDGVNDSLALLESDIGICLKTQVELPLFCSDIIFTNQDISKIKDLQLVSRELINIEKQNIIISLLISLILLIIYIYLEKLNIIIILFSMLINIFLIKINCLRIKKK